ncbi:MAG: SCO family protein [Chthoniobacteraceae bacterium]
MPGKETFLLIAMLAGISCRREPAPAGSGVQHFDVVGTVQSVDAPRHSAIIAHEAIATYMAAMTMPFQFADELDLSNVERGDRLRFRLAISETRAWIDGFDKCGHVDLPPPAPASKSDARIGATPPNVELRNQDGNAFRLNELRGRAVALTFMFTRCPYPEMCPRLSRQFADAQRALLITQPEARWLLLSVSIDPDHDTPAQLAAYAQTFAAHPKHWKFATGSRDAIEQLSSWFGLEMIRGAGPALDHTLRTAIIDPSGKVQRIFFGNDWRSEDLVTELQRALDGHRERSAAESNDPD